MKNSLLPMSSSNSNSSIAASLSCPWVAQWVLHEGGEVGVGTIRQQQCHHVCVTGSSSNLKYRQIFVFFLFVRVGVGSPEKADTAWRLNLSLAEWTCYLLQHSHFLVITLILFMLQLCPLLPRLHLLHHFLIYFANNFLKSHLIDSIHIIKQWHTSL